MNFRNYVRCFIYRGQKGQKGQSLLLLSNRDGFAFMNTGAYLFKHIGIVFFNPIVVICTRTCKDKFLCFVHSVESRTEGCFYLLITLLPALKPNHIKMCVSNHKLLHMLSPPFWVNKNNPPLRHIGSDKVATSALEQYMFLFRVNLCKCRKGLRSFLLPHLLWI